MKIDQEKPTFSNLLQEEKRITPPPDRVSVLQKFTQFLQNKNLKQTRQRFQILDVFMNLNRHVCADELYEMVRKKDPEIAFSTVYRTLHLLVESGIAREQEFHKGRKFYEQVVGERGHHHHIVCTSCGKIVEFSCPEIVERWQEEIAKNLGFILQGHTHELFGLCSNCRSKEKE